MRQLHPDILRVLPMLAGRAALTAKHGWNMRGGSRAVADVLAGWQTAAPGAYAVPFLSPVACDRLVEWTAEHRDAFAPNLLEEEPFRIDELVVSQHNPALFEHLCKLAEHAMFPVLQLIHGKTPEAFTSIQFAHYNPKCVSHGNWHHDDDSDQTIVVSLAPELFEGGGTDIMVDLARNKWVTIPPLPKGYALVFNGKMMLHRGRRVERGDRHLLVFWTEGKA